MCPCTQWKWLRGRGAIGLVLAGAGLSVIASAQTAAAQSPAATARTLTTQYCVGCHNAKAKVAGVSFEGVDWTNPGSSADILEKALRKLNSGEMPPAGMPRPTPAAVTAFTTWLSDSLDQYAAAHPNPGRPAIHRLNRAEYSNAIRDLLALDTKPGALLPVDDSGYGFDNIGDVLSVSPSLLERYISAARKVSRMAVGDPSIKPSEEEILNPVRGARDRVSDDLPFDSGGGMSISYYFPLDAEYVIRVKSGGGDNGPAHEVRMPIQAGLRTIGATFLKESTKPEIANTGGRRGVGAPPPQGGGGRGAAPPPAQLDLRLDGARLKLFAVCGRSPFEPPAFPANAAPSARVLSSMGHFSLSGVSRQLIPLVISRGGSEPIWFRPDIHIAPLCGVNSGSSNDPFRTSLDAQRFHCYGLSYAREEDRSR